MIPITVGEGIIPSFTTAVQSIIQHLGFQAVATTGDRCGGIAEGVAAGANILFMADDKKFIALNVLTGTAADNGEATGKGFQGSTEWYGRAFKAKVLVLGARPSGSECHCFTKEVGSDGGSL